MAYSGDSPLPRTFHLDEGWRGLLLRTDWISPLVMFIISAFGCAVIYSSASNSVTPYWRQQMVFLAGGWLVYAGVALMDYRVLRRYVRYVYWAGVALLAPIAVCALLRKDLGTVIKTVNGARRWIDVGPIKIQPSEFAKVTTLVMLAAVMEGVRSWSWGDARILRAARGRDPAWAVALGLVLWVPVRLAGWAAFLASAILVPWFYLRHGAKWQSHWKPVALAPRTWDPFVFAGLVAVHPGMTVAAVAALPIGLIFIQPDLKSCIVYLPMLASLLYLLTRISLRTFAAIGLSAALLAGAVGWDMSGYARHVQAYIVAHPDSKNPGEAVRGEYQKISPIPAALLKDYQRERIMSFVRPELIDPRGTGNTWNVKQAVIATGRGGLWGTGWNQGSQAKLGYLPELAAHNDFVVSVFLEEFGFVGGALLLAGYALLIGNTLRTAARARDRFGALLCVGAAAVLTVHVVVNIGMNIGLMPVSGLPLPFLSYGGSFVLSCFLLLGLVQSVHRYSRELPPRSGSGSDISTNALKDMRKPAATAV